MELKVEVAIDLNPTELANKMSINDMSLLLSAIADKLDDDFINRSYCARQFAAGLTENGARFLAETVTHRFDKKKK